MILFYSKVFSPNKDSKFNFSGILGDAPGTIVALFQVEPLATNVSNAVPRLLSNPNVIPNLNLVSLNINSRSYLASPPSDNNTTTSTESSNTNAFSVAGLIVGLVGGLFLFGIVLFYLIHQRILANNRLGPIESDGVQLTGVNESVASSPTPSTDVALSDVETIAPTPVLPNPLPPNRIHVSQYLNLPQLSDNSPAFNEVEDL